MTVASTRYPLAGKVDIPIVEILCTMAVPHVVLPLSIVGDMTCREIKFSTGSFANVVCLLPLEPYGTVAVVLGAHRRIHREQRETKRDTNERVDQTG